MSRRSIRPGSRREQGAAVVPESAAIEEEGHSRLPSTRVVDRAISRSPVAGAKRFTPLLGGTPGGWSESCILVHACQSSAERLRDGCLSPVPRANHPGALRAVNGCAHAQPPPPAVAEEWPSPAGRAHPHRPHGGGARASRQSSQLRPRIGSRSEEGCAGSGRNCGPCRDHTGIVTSGNSHDDEGDHLHRVHADWRTDHPGPVKVGPLLHRLAEHQPSRRVAMLRRELHL